MESPKEPRRAQISTVLIAIIVLSSLFAGAMAGYFLSYLPLSNEIDNLQSKLSTLNQRIDSLQTPHTLTSILGENVYLPQLFDQVRQSVVVIEGLIANRDFFGRVYYTQVQGSSITLVGRW